MKEYVSLQTVLDVVMQYCPDDDGSCTKVDRDIRDLLDEIEALPIVELQTIKDVVVPNLEKHNIKRAYPDMTDSEVAAYILGFTEHEKLNMGHCYIDSEGYERCSVCNEHETGMRYFSFCPRCGVKLKR